MARTRRKVNHVLDAAPAELQAPAQRVYQTGGYVRLSVEDSGKPGADTIEAQRELVQNFILSQPDMNLCGVFSDNGRTGTNFDRPGFLQLMGMVREGKIDCIVVKDLSRFGRNYLETGNYLERVFPLLDVRFVAISDSFDTLTAERSTDGYIVPLKNIMNELYSKDISQKIRPALVSKQQRGDFIGSWASYGYRKRTDDPHRIEIDPETAPIVREIFQWRLSGMAITQISRKLNERGTPSPAKYHYLKGEVKAERYANVVWHPAVINQILGSEVYLGHTVQGRKRSRFCEGQKQEVLPRDQWTVVRDTHQPLIDTETFQAVQELNAERNAAYHARLGCYDALGTTPNILKKLVFCADCGRPLVRYKNVSNKGTNRYYVFICQSHSDDPASCPKKYIHESVLVEVLWDTVRRELELAGAMEKLVKKYSRSAEHLSQETSLARQVADVQKRLSRANALYDSLYQNYVDKLMTETEYTELKEQYRSDIKAAEARLAELNETIRTQQRQTVQNPWLTNCTRYRDESRLTDEVAHALIERIEVDADNHVSITMRYRNEYLALARLLNTGEGDSFA